MIRHALTLAFGALLVGGATVAAQDRPLPVADSASTRDSAAVADWARVLVTGLAGATIYVSLEDRPVEALEIGTVLDIAQTDGGPAMGRLKVVELAGRRLLTQFDGDPFSVTRGDVLYLVSEAATDALLAAGSRSPRALKRPDRIGIDTAGPSGERGASGRRPSAAVDGPRLSGMFSLESDLRRSTSHFSGVRSGSIDRTFATPSGRLRATLSGLPGGVRVHTSLRAYNRDRDSRRPVQESQVQVFEAYASASPRGSPITLKAGRFLNRHESYTGYWDGGLLRLGTRGFGIGAVAGWEPTVREERFDRNLFKYGGFAGIESGSGSLRYRATVSAVRTEPGFLAGDPGSTPVAGLPARTILGAAQRLTAGALRIHANAEAERDTSSAAWTLSRANVGASLRNGPVTVRGNASRLRGPIGIAFDPTLDPQRAGPRLGPARDRVGAGLSLRVGSGSVGGDATIGRDRLEHVSHTYAAHLLLPQALPSSLGLRLNGFYWEDDRANAAWSGYASLSRRFGKVRAELGYRIDRSERTGLAVVSHGLQIAISVQGTTGWSYHMNGFARRGADLQTDHLYSRLSRSF